jgi:ABC-2 type transport system permease protein
MRAEVTRLVAMREIRERGRSRAFLISTLVVLAGVLTAAILPAVLSSDDTRPTYDVAVVASAVGPRPLAAAAAAAGVDVRTRTVGDAPAARAAVRNGTADLAVVGDREILLERPVADSPQALVRLAGAVSQTVPLAAALRGAGLDPAAAARVTGAPPLPVRALEPSQTSHDDRIALAWIGVLLLYVALLTYGAAVLNGVVEEKTSRVVEVLLSAVRPVELLTGKTTGIALLGLAQLVIVGVPSAIVAVALGSVDLPSGSVGAVAGIVLWFALGFAFYCVAYAAVGSLVSRQEDAQAAAAPLTLVVVSAFLVTIPAISEPNSTLAQVLSFVPFTAPLTMIARVAQGVSPGVFAAAAGAMLVAVVLMTWAAARIYTYGILRTGPRVSLRQAWRGVRRLAET